MKRIIYILSVLLFVSCSTKKIITKTSVVIKKDSLVSIQKQQDSIVIKRKEILIPAVKTSLELSNPCDSLGNLKKAVFSTSIGKLKLNVIVDPITKKIYIKANYDSIKSVYESKYYKKSKSDSLYYAKNHSSVVVNTSKITKYRMSFWGWFSILINIILAVIIIKFIKR